jgi:hypothetical protein
MQDLRDRVATKTKVEIEATDGLRTKMFSRIGKIVGNQAVVVRVAHGIPNRVDRIRAIGNGQVPRVAATAWRILRGH